MGSIEVKMVLEKETKGTVRYKEVVASAVVIVIGTLYIKKAVLPTPYPKEIVVQIDY